ncbi:MAG: DUF1501 domain-containing protein [Planctomycetota bacterium]|nr:DUF1501 domain-containing protein [Planctomycetota bacterium]MDA1139120.1 DUF1501 domain-containing protein [Planctomycetota bacterium]
MTPSLTRRELLHRSTLGLGSLALADLLNAGGDSRNPLGVKQPHYPAKVKRVIHLFMNGGPSQVDTFDPKPMLDKYDGKTLPTGNLRTERATGSAMRSPFKFKKYGKVGLDVSELFSNVGECADDLCVIRSMHTNVPNHEPSLMLMNCGDSIMSRPSVGSWLLYGLGTENQNMPGFIVLCPGGRPVSEAANWRSSFLPGIYQGTHIDTKRARDKLLANATNRVLTTEQQRRQLDYIQQLNVRHLMGREGDSQIEARIQSLELAFRMQTEATDAFAVEKEPRHIREMYGNGLQARQMMMARRLVERGVRYVQVWHGAGQPWDSHNDLECAHRRLARECDQPIAALLKDLKQRGMLEDTLVIWGGEFGRTPAVELPNPQNGNAKLGRDHNNHGFTMWLAGGGVKAGYIHGTTDEFGFKAVDGRIHIHDFHATLLHLLGFDHEKLTYRYAGRDFRLTDVHGEVVKELLA